MQEIIDREFQLFLNDIQTKDSIKIKRYVNETYYENKYSEDEINDAKNLFIKKVKEYMHIHCPEKYIVFDGCCVMILTIEEAKLRKISKGTIELFVVK